MVSVMLFSLGGAFAIWEAIRTVPHPHSHDHLVWAYAVLGGGFVFEPARATRTSAEVAA